VTGKFNWKIKHLHVNVTQIYPCTRHKGIGAVEVQLRSFLISALEREEWLASQHCRITHGERACEIQLISGRVGPRTSLKALNRRKISSLLEIQRRSLHDSLCIYYTSCTVCRKFLCKTEADFTVVSFGNPQHTDVSTLYSRLLQKH
jgi:hypothetical protein